MIKLRYYQLKLVQDIMDAIAAGNQEILVVSPTGSGKTAIIGSLLANLLTTYKLNKSLIAEPFLGIIEQTRGIIKTFGIDPTITTYNSASNYQNTQVLILDEAQHCRSKTGKAIIDGIFYYYLIGFTATPYRTDGQKFLKKHGGPFDCIIMGPAPDELTKEGYLSNIIYYNYPMEYVQETETKAFNGISFTEQRSYYTVPNKKDKIVEEYATHFKGTSGIAFNKTVFDSKTVVNKFNGVGISADYVSCYRTSEENKQAVDNFQKGQIKILAACNMASEGVDMPIAKLAIMARPIKESLSMFNQQIGRILRPYNDEPACVLDLVGNTVRHPEISKLYETVPIN